MRGVVNYKKFRKSDYSDFVLGADVGGTNTRLGVSGLKGRKVELLFGFETETSNIRSFGKLIRRFLRYSRERGVCVRRACFGVAGAISDDGKSCRLTNSNLRISLTKVMRKSGLKEGYLLNDFEAIGYVLEDVKLGILRRGKGVKKANKAILGPGTGLGKSIMVYSDGDYVSVSSEGGHSEFPAVSERDFEIVEFLKRKGISLEWESLVSGKGILNLYNFFLSKGFESEIRKEVRRAKSVGKKAALISKNRRKDKVCSKVFYVFSELLGRCAGNFVLESYARGGLYLTGGVLHRNNDILKSFRKEFERVGKGKRWFSSVPVYFIKDELAGLKGACYYAGFVR